MSHCPCCRAHRASGRPHPLARLRMWRKRTVRKTDGEIEIEALADRLHEIQRINFAQLVRHYSAAEMIFQFEIRSSSLLYM